MPHLRIEYSASVAGRFEPATLVEAACKALLSSGVFSPADSTSSRFRIGVFFCSVGR